MFLWASKEEDETRERDASLRDQHHLETARDETVRSVERSRNGAGQRAQAATKGNSWMRRRRSADRGVAEEGPSFGGSAQ
jgi:hypothetical protein